MVQLCKRIAKIAHEMVGKASSPETAAELGQMANILTKQYSDLVKEQQGASAVCPTNEVCSFSVNCLHHIYRTFLFLILAGVCVGPSLDL